MSEKLKKKNIKFETWKRQFMSVPDFSQYRELQFLGPSLPRKNSSSSDGVHHRGAVV